MEKLFIYKCENITMKNGLVNNFVYAYNLTKDKYMYLLNSDLKEYDVTYLDWLVNDFYYIYGPIMLEETVKKNYVGEELFKEVATHINEIDKEYFHIIKEKLGVQQRFECGITHECLLEMIDETNSQILRYIKK